MIAASTHTLLRILSQMHAVEGNDWTRTNWGVAMLCQCLLWVLVGFLC